MEIKDRFQSAVYRLAGDGPVKTRLIEAFSEHLEDLDDTLLPLQIESGFLSLREALQQHRPVGRETAVEATVRKMSTAQASVCAFEIVTLLLRLLHESNGVERLRVVGGQRGQIVASVISEPSVSSVEPA